MKLYENQKEISENIFSRLENKELFNLPTGIGKSYILLDVAKKSLKNNKRVIISAPNNALAREMMDIAMQDEVLKDYVKLTIGRDNYIDRSKYLSFINNDLYLDYIENSKDELLEFLNNDNELFFDDFEQILKVVNTASINVLKSLVCKSLGSEHNGEFGQLSITNHFYLISKITYDKNSDYLNNSVVLIDEVHQVSDAAEQVLNEQFSVFEHSSIFSSLIKELGQNENLISKSALKSIKSLANNLKSVLLSFSSDKNAGLYVSGYENNTKFFDTVLSVYDKDLTAKIKKSLTDTLEKMSHNLTIEQAIKTLSSGDSFVKKLSSQSASCGVYHSSVRGYPKITLLAANPLGLLNNKLWKKINYFAGVSATITSSFSPSKYEIKYGYERIGFLQKSREEYNIHFYDRVFPRENINIHLPKENNVINSMINVYSSVFDPEQDIYYKDIVTTIANTFEGKNSLVLTSGYKEAEYIANLLSFKDLGVKIHKAKSTEKTSTTIKKFREQGGILIGVRNYNTGISLPKEELEKLYILKFPFSDFTSLRWQEMKSKSAASYYVKFEREMLMTLMQTLGRIQRTKEDKGDIYILDSKYYNYNSSRKSKILDILNAYGVVVDEKNTNANNEDFKEKVDELKNLLGL